MAYDPYKELGVTPAPYDPYKELGVASEPQGGLIAAAKQVVGQTVKGVGQLGADYLPGVTQDNTLTRYGQEVVDANPTQVRSLEDIVDKPWMTVKEAVGNALPSVGGALGLRAAGQGITALAPLAGPAAPLVAGLGQAVSWGGPVVAAALPSYSGIRDAQLEEGKNDTASKLLGLGGAAAVGGIEMLGGPQARILKAMTGGLKREAGESIYKAIGKEGLKSALEEGAEELVQNPIEQVASYQNPTTPENVKETLFGGAMGFVGGGVLGGGMQAVSGRKEKEPPPPEVEDAQSKMLAAVTNIEGAVVKNGMATIPVGEEQITVPVDKLAEHLSKGGSLDDVDTAAMTSDTLSMLQRAVQDERNPLTFDDLVNLRNDPAALQEAGVNRKDVDSLLVDQVKEVEGGPQFVQQMLASGQADGKIIEQMKRGEFTPAPMQAEWEQQATAARIANQTKLNQLFPEQNPPELEAYWRSLTGDQPTTLASTATPSPGEAAPRVSVSEPAINEAQISLPSTGETQSVASQSQASLWRKSDLATAPDISEDRIQAKKQADGTYKLFYRGTKNEVFQDEVFPSAAIARNTFKAEKVKAQQYAKNVETIDTTNDVPVGTNMAGEQLFERAETGERYRVRADNAKQPIDFGGDLAPVEPDTLLSQAPPWETGPVQKAEEIAPIVQQVNPQVKYDGAMADLHGFTLTLPDGRQPSFSVKGAVTPESFTAALNDVETRFGVPLTAVPVSVPQTAKNEAQTSLPLTGDTQTVTTTLDQEFGRGAVARLTRQGKLQIVASANEIPDGDRLSANQQQTARGVYKTETGKIYLVAGNLSKDNVSGVFKHEVVHALLRQDAAFMQRRGELIADFEKLIGKDASVDAAVAQVPQTTRGAVRTEEALAYWVQNDANHKHSLFRRMVAVVKAALRRLGIPVTSMTTADFSRLFAQGTEAFVNQEGQVEQPATEEQALLSQQQFAEVDTTSANFKRWFKGSKTVDANGAPIPLFHGTTATKVEELKPNYRKGEQLGFGIHLTPDPEFASRYADTEQQGRKKGAGNVLKTYAAVRNPLDADGIVVEGSPEFAFALKLMTPKNKFLFQPEFTNDMQRTGRRIVYLKNLIDSVSPQKAEKALRDAGYDGVWYTADIRSAPLPNGQYEKGPSARTLIVLDSAQVKSAISNTGEFSSENPNLLFSQASTAHQQARSNVTANLKEMANEKLTEASPFFLRVSPLRTLVQTLGKQIPQIAKISNAFDEMSHTSTSTNEDALGNYKENQRVNKKATGSMDAFSKAATLASFYRMTPWKNLDEQEWIPSSAGASRGDKLAAAEMQWKSEGMDKATGKSFIAAWTEAAAAYRDLKTDEAKKQYQKMARHMRHIRKREETNVLAAIERGTVGKPVLRAAMMERFNDTFRSIKGVYWPLTRWGEYTLEFVDTDGVKVRMQFPSIGGRRAFINDMVKDGVDPQTIKTGYLAKTPRGQVAIPNELMQQFSQAIVAERTQGLDPEEDADAFQAAAQEAQSTIDDLNQIWLRWQPETSALKSSLRRKNIKGYDLDAGRGYLEYIQRHAQKIAWTEQGRVIEDELKGLNDELREERKAGKNTDLKSMVLQDLRARVQAARDTHVGPIASLLGKLGTAYYMTSPSIALVQMTQLPMLTLPKLGVMYKSPGKAAAALTKAIKESFSKKFSRDALYGNDDVNELHNASRLIVTDEMRQTLGETDRTLGSRVYTEEEIAASFAKLKPDQQKLFVLREALARNLLDISAVHEAYAIAGGKDPNSVWRKAFDLAMTPMRVSEQASRKAAILATMDLAQKAGKGYEGIMVDVQEVVHDTLYSYDKANKPVFLQGSTGRVLAMFQWYRIMTMFRMALLFKRSIMAESPEVRKAAQKEFIGIMGMAGALAGTMGMPMAGLIFAALDAGADDDEPKDSALEWRKMLQEGFGERLGNIAAYGLPAAVGMHLTKRIGMGDMFGMQSSPPPNLAGKDLAAWWAASQLGPAFSIGQSWVQGYDEAVNKGDVMRGLETAMPKPVKDAMKAYRVWSEGEMKTASGKRVLGPNQITPDMVPMLALGFNPLEAAKASENRYSLAKLGAGMSRRRGQLINAAADALEGDGDFDQARERIIAFNQKNPQFRIKSGEIRTALKRNRKAELGIPSKRERGLSMAYGIPPVE